MSKAEKRGHSWRVRVYDYTDENGKRHNVSFTAPTKAEAELKAAEFKANKKRSQRAPRDLTVGEAVDRYIQLKALLSPTTLQAYATMRRFAFPRLMAMRVSKLTDEIVQLAINEEARRIAPSGKPLSAKTVKNEYALISGALSTVCKLHFQVTLPTYQRHKKPLPDPVDVVRAFIFTDIELPCFLAMWESYSMSEIRGLKCSDLRGNMLTINRVKVEVNGRDVVKDTAKQETRLRTHELDDFLVQMIHSTEAYQNYLKTGVDGFLVPYNRKTIYEKWRDRCEEYGLGDLDFHSLRHVNCSIMVLVGVADTYINERGGWKSSLVPNAVYKQTFPSQRKADDAKVNNELHRLISAIYEERGQEHNFKNVSPNVPHNSQKPCK